MNKILEFVGATTGIVGAILVAVNIPESKYGFLLFLISSITLTIFSYKEQLKSLMVMQFVFMGINTIGVYRWFI